MDTDVTIEEWLAIGRERGFVGPPVCYEHDGVPTTLAEDDEAEETGEYPCLHILRLYPDAQTKAEVEMNHPPTTWR